MTQRTIDTPAARACDPATSLTRSLLGYGVLAGPVYVLGSLGQALASEGFDLTRHSWSLLSAGEHGWIHITVFLVTGLMVLAFAAGLRRAWRPARGRTWGPRLMAAYGAGLLGGGVMVADPAMGYPAGTPEGVATVSWHGIMHLVCGGLGFICFLVAAFALARGFAAEGRRGWAAFSRITGAVFVVTFAGIASGAGGPATVLPFTAAVILTWTWMAALAVHLYRRAGE
ncbi:hypothetical protein Sru01_26840 [Sphaerisporangium rufum]|uniref:DUF998 domain-containing protein n=1 Tax=Sphaerisporangium rufum TaxID=1381558 RepID=A0A919R118_9ACTN|nr:DUF998 domain-containing protein [Sphaerisporangium rufum]GII77702.1 hypothetical protein Sru01_26840 [Sphaerisporangium rufum]